MPIVFISLNKSFNDKISSLGYTSKTMKIQDYSPIRKTYYVSPANVLCFMDSGIDYALSRIVFPDIEPYIKSFVKLLNIKNKIGRYYLPIGSSIIIDTKNNKSLCVSPTMLLPQNVSGTQNAYIATMAVLYNILVNRQEDINNVDILFTSLCCGYGKMSEDESIKQIINGINNYKNYNPKIRTKNSIINEPNLHLQPKYYQNTEWFDIDPSEIINC